MKRKPPAPDCHLTKEDEERIEFFSLLILLFLTLGVTGILWLLGARPL